MFFQIYFDTVGVKPAVILKLRGVFMFFLRIGSGWLKGLFVVLLISVLSFSLSISNSKVFAVSQAKDYTIPGGQGTLTSNVWRSTSATYSGNTIQWDWQVSAVYSGNVTVEMIKTEWYSTASLRNSASITMGVSGDGASAGASSSWQTVQTKVKYWTNTNGAKSSSWRSNIVIAPEKDYRSGTIATINTAYVKLKGDPRTYYISAGV
ncbi:hypothetical protein GT20_3288 [Parageobacillus thermoglucosidasius TNO-09.020]|nr:hypothetical protein GT20_3288 [Parageobacillus thermoglucosidasius TNO-09.020]